MTLIEKEDKRVSQAVTNHARCETLGVEIHLGIQGPDLISKEKRVLANASCV